tara:strand:- start:2298 stop:2741 length:444 start_codon:yes stop_codon:yes gene_type:complete
LISPVQYLPCHRRHCWNLPIPKRAQSVHPIGHPISHATHGGFSLPDSAERSMSVPRFGRSLPTLPPLPPLFDPYMFAVGVGSIDPHSVASMRCARVPSPQHTPANVIPQAGKTLDDDAKPTGAKVRAVFRENKRRPNLSNNSEHFKP